MSIAVQPAEAREFTVRIRVPDRATSDLYRSTPIVAGLKSLTVNGTAMTPVMEQGYAVIRRQWKAGDRIELELPLEVQRVKCSEKVRANLGRVALRRGPVVYNIESADQNIDQVLAPDAPLTTEWRPELLGGVMVIKGTFANGSPMIAIPNYARLNRGGRSVVWIKDR